MGGMAIVSLLLTIVCFFSFVWQCFLPFNSEGRYFDAHASVVYNDYTDVYALLSFAFLGLTLFLTFIRKDINKNIPMAAGNEDLT